MKTYLDVPYAEKDQAKEKGARFDMSAKRWYCPDGVDMMLFKRWLPKGQDSVQKKIYQLKKKIARDRRKQLQQSTSI